jgi:G3E family GTPase
LVGVARPTSSYGVSHFVYRARLPFHPVRLHDFMVKFFILQEPDWSRMMTEDGTHSDSASDGGSSDGEPAAAAAAAASVGVQGKAQSTSQLQSVAIERRAALEATFGVVLRSKGFVWVASRSDHIGEWSQAGSLLSFSTGQTVSSCTTPGGGGGWYKGGS